MSVALLLPTARRCVDCGQRTRWVHSAIGRPLLIDAEPSVKGDRMLVLDDGRWVAEYRRPDRAIALREGGAELYQVHSCPSYSRHAS